MRRLIPIVLVLLLAACGGDSTSDDDPPTVTVAVSPTATSLPVSQSTPLPEVEDPPEPDVQTLVVWWPETLPVDEELETQLQAFVAAEGNLEIEFRLKRVGDVGGIMSTLRAGISVAPGAMPDLTLMRREDIITAVQTGLIQPMEGATSASASVLGGLYPVALELGTINDQFYGLAYILSVLHAVNAEDTNNLSWAFADVLERGEPFVFPASRQNGVNDTFMLQYLAAGGNPPDDDGTMTLNTEALLTVLTFYENAVEAGVVSPEVFEYSSTNDYQTELAAGNINLAAVRANLYLDLRSNGQSWFPVPIPTESGEATSLVDGWMWVMVATDSEQQAIAVRFLNWMMTTERQRQYAESILRIPSQEVALRNMDRNLLQTSVMDELITNGTITVPPAVSVTLTRAMQNALVAVINGELTATQATQDVVDVVGVTE